MKVAIFGAFPQELRHILRNLKVTLKAKNPFTLFVGKYSFHDIIVVQSGMGRAGTEAAFNFVIQEYRPDFVLSAGFGGALYDNAKVGDLIWGSKVCLASDRVTDTVALQKAGEVSPTLSDLRTMREGCIVTLERWMKKSEVNRILPDGCSAPVCDMETFFLAKLSLQRGIPFYGIRSVTDCAGEEIPFQLLSVSDESGKYGFFQAVSLLMRKPQLIPAAMKLGISSVKASRSLWKAIKSLIDVL